MAIGEANRICINQQPSDIFTDFLCMSEKTNENLRNPQTRFIPFNHKRIGQHVFVNRLSNILRCLPIDISKKLLNKQTLKKLLSL